MSFRFLLGIHRPHWLESVQVPVFVSRRRLAKRKSAIRATSSWALDSGGFTELSQFGTWTVTAKEYAAEVKRWSRQIGGLLWASAMDWMCEPIIIHGGKLPNGVIVPGTHLSVREHQRRTVANYLELLTLAPDLPWVPVLQGWEIGEYLQHVRDYRSEGIDLASLPLVGLGSVCRRQATAEAEELVRILAKRGIRLHGFGFKTAALPRVARWLVSSDSLAWSFTARRENIRLSGCVHRQCNNCLRWALLWRKKVIRAAHRCKRRPAQCGLYDGLD